MPPKKCGVIKSPKKYRTRTTARMPCMAHNCRLEMCKRELGMAIDRHLQRDSAGQQQQQQQQQQQPGQGKALEGVCLPETHDNQEPAGLHAPSTQRADSNQQQEESSPRAAGCPFHRAQPRSSSAAHAVLHPPAPPSCPPASHTLQVQPHPTPAVALRPPPQRPALPPLLLLLLLPSPSSPSLLPPAPARAAEVALPRRRGCLCMRRKGPARLSAAAMRGRPRTWRAS